MVKKTLRQRFIIFLILFLIMAIFPMVVTASQSVAGHNTVRKIILIGGYDACNNSLVPICPSDPVPNPAQPHNRGTEHPKWAPVIDFQTKGDPGGSAENALVRKVDLKDEDFFILSYALGSGRYAGTPFDFEQPNYTAIDTCLSTNKTVPRFGLYCLVETSEIEKVVQNISEIMNDPRYSTAEFDIISFSEGGVVATYWAATADEQLLKRVNSIITIDSPLQGDVSLPYIGIKILFLSDDVRQMIAVAPPRVPIYTIRNTKDNVVPWDEATLSGVWNDSGREISTLATLFNHDVRPNLDVQKRIALALVSGKIMRPTTTNPRVVKLPLPLVFDLAKPTFTQDLIEDDFVTTIDATSAGVNLALWRTLGYTKMGRIRAFVTPPDLADGIYDLTVDTENTHLPNIVDTEMNAVVYGPTANVDVILAIDRSGSMFGQKIASAKDAAKTFVNFMNEGDKIGVVSFSSTTRIAFPLTTITSDSTRDDAKAAIDAISAGGLTSIGGGLQAGLNELNSKGDPLHPHAIVLVSNGAENTAPFVDNVLPGVRQAGVIVNTIGLGAGANTALLQRIAAETGGVFRFAPSAAELLEIYNAVFGAVSGQQTVFAGSGVVQQGQTAQQTASLDSTIAKATFSITWAGSDLDLTLVTPSGNLIDPATAAGDPAVEFASGSTFEFYRIESPEAGEWLINITGTAVVSPAGEPFTTRVTAEPGLQMMAETDRTSYLTNDPILVLASLADIQPIVGADVTAIIRTPLGVSQISLLDDGVHEDSVGGDGLYANLFEDTLQDGIYSIEVQARGNSNTGEPFGRVAELDIVVEQNPAPPADLFVEKIGPAQVKPGSQIIYTITIGNNGPGTARDVVLTDLAPEGTSVMGDTLGGGTELPGGITWSVGNLAAGFEGTFELTILLPPTITGSITNTVGINSMPPDLTALASSDPNFDNNNSTVITQVVNRLPVADAGTDQAVECSSPQGASVALYGTGSFDPDGDDLTFGWSAPGIVFDDPTSPTAMAAFPLGTTTVTLVVNDGQLDSAPDTVDITVQDTVPSVLFAEWVPLEVEEDEGEFILEFGATDVCDSATQVTGVVETPNLDGLEIDLETGTEVQIEFDLEGGKVEIKGPDPEALLAQLQSFGGLLVDSGQQVKVELEEDDEGELEFKFEEDGTLKIEVPSATLKVTGEDASGNTTTVQVSPEFAPEEDDDELDDDNEAKEDVEDNDAGDD